MSNFLNSALHRHLLKYLFILMVGVLGILVFSAEVKGEVSSADSFCSPVEAEVDSFLEEVDLRRQSFREDLSNMSKRVRALYQYLQAYESKTLKLDDDLMQEVYEQAQLLELGSEQLTELIEADDKLAQAWLEKLEECNAPEEQIIRIETFNFLNFDHLSTTSEFLYYLSEQLTADLETYRSWEAEKYLVNPGDFESLAEKSTILKEFSVSIDDNYICVIEPLQKNRDDYVCSTKVFRTQEQPAR